eukprot:COSAG06_NODE_49622_length_324_cov_0.688889_1_plen_44_part_01
MRLTHAAITTRVTNAMPTACECSDVFSRCTRSSAVFETAWKDDA